MRRRRSKVKLAFIENSSTRRTSFNKRTKGLKKKLEEITTLCDVKACAVIHNPFEASVEMWPSPQGVEEVTSRFMQMPAIEQVKKMVNHETYLHGRINKEHKDLRKLFSQNRESQLRQLMFDCLDGKMNEHPFDPMEFQDLRSYLNDNINKLNHRINYLTEHGEASSSSVPLHPPVVANVDAPIVAAGGYVQNQPHPVQHHVPDDFYQYMMSMNQNQHEPVPTGHYNQYEPVQHHDPILQYQNQHEAIQYHAAPNGFIDHIQNENMNMNQDQHGPAQNQPHGVYGTNLDLSLYPYQQESSINMVVRDPLQEVGFVGEHAYIPFMDGYHQLQTNDLATSEDTTASVHAPLNPYFNNNL